jgi:hypothetical protein
MGLFDTIRCEHPLPDACTASEFQTKSLGCGLDTYRLMASGRLLDAQGADTGMHGVLRMVTSDRAGCWWEYEAKFTNGQLVHLVPASQARFGDSGMLQPKPRPVRHEEAP